METNNLLDIEVENLINTLKKIRILFEVDQHNIKVDKLIDELQKVKEAGGETIDIIPVTRSNINRMYFVSKELQHKNLILILDSLLKSKKDKQGGESIM